MLSMTRYNIKNEHLKPWVKFIWHFEVEDANIHYKLLPTDSIDIILNLTGDLFYEVDSHCISASPFHINGLRSKHSYIHQTGNISIFGISFYPFGLYPFVNKSLANIHDRIIDLQNISETLSQKLQYAVSGKASTEVIIENIEKALSLELKVTEEYINKGKLICDFLDIDKDVTIQSFCLKYGINTKTFQRNVLRYTGYTPKALRSIKRFQQAGSQLIYNPQSQLTDVAYDNKFSDQAHFIREFQKFSGAAPRAFQQEKITVKENTEYIYR